MGVAGNPRTARAANDGEEADPFHLIYTTTLGYSWLSHEATRAAEFADSSEFVAFGLTLEFQDLVSVALHWEPILPDDRAAFEQTVIDTMSVVSDEESAVFLSFWGPSIGLRTPLYCFSCNEGTSTLTPSASATGWAACFSGVATSEAPPASSRRTG